MKKKRKETPFFLLLLLVINVLHICVDVSFKKTHPYKKKRKKEMLCMFFFPSIKEQM
jgi:hypothetical protein